VTDAPENQIVYELRPLARFIGGHSSKTILYTIDNSGCWLCVSHRINSEGYPSICRGGHMMNASRYVYSKLHKIEKGMCVLHSCDNKQCINPDHLELGAQSKNVQDAYIRGLIPTKLTKEAVSFIRTSTMKGIDLAKRFNVAHTTIWKVRNRIYWRHLADKF
jgi:hypothetical protein